MAYQVILEPGIGQFREFEFPRVRTRINFCGTFSCALIDLRKARERELATLDEKSTTSGRWTLCANKNEVNNRGGGRDDNCDHGLYVQKLEGESVPKEKKNSLEEIVNQQSAARSTSSTKQHKLIAVSYVPTQPLALDGQTTTATESGTTTTTKHTAYISPKSLLGQKKHQKNNAIPGRMHATHGFLPWILSTYYDLRVAQLSNKRNDYFSPCFLCRKCIPCFLVHSPPMP